MQCPKCQFQNRDGARFCNECGFRFTIACPKCNRANPPGSKFCDDCGQSLTPANTTSVKELTFDEKIQKIQKYLPGGLTEKILVQRGKIEGERKQVTVLFADMENFTPLVEKLSPEEAYSIMDQVYEILIHKINDFEGTVNEMTGDGVMALFGAPIALEDAPQRAIRSALAIHQEIARLSDRMKQEKGISQIKMRIGIHTGSVIVGTLGNDLRVEFKAVGDTVNLASRIQNIAAAGTTYVSDDTFKLTEGLFRFESLGPKAIKGKEQPIHIYQVIAPSTRRTRFDVSAERGLTPFVGRQRELELLLDGYERSKEGRGQAISIISEAGIGKSRLLYEFRKTVTNEDILFLEGKCLSYSCNVAYHPVVDVLKTNFDIQDDDTDQSIRKKVTQWLKITKVDEPSTLPYLLELLSVKDSGIEKIPMSPEARKDRTLEALKRIVLKGSELRPLIMAIEDLHWMDRISEDAFKELLDSISGARVFLIFTYRPEFVHTWGSRSYHSQVTLNKLSNRESLAMVSHLLNNSSIDKDIENLTLSKAEGVPFFIEEFIKSLRELKIIERVNGTYKLTRDFKTISIPSTIQDVIMARVDHLPEQAREVLRTGSAIEREFSHELIQKVSKLPEQELLSHLSTLRDSELLYERGIYPNSTYIFKHALTREVVYDTILTNRKKKLHEDIGYAIEEIHKHTLSEHYEVLAQHYFLSENHLKAAEYSRLAFKKAVKTNAVNDAIAYAKKRITSLERSPQTEDIEKQILHARTALGVSMTQLNYFVEAKETIGPILNLAIKYNYNSELCQIYTVLAMYEISVEENCPRAFEYFEKALKISEEIRDKAISLWFVRYWIGVACGFICEHERSAKYLQLAVDMSLAANSLWGNVIAKNSLAYFSYYIPGKINLQFQTTYEAIRIAEESGDIYSKALSYVLHGVSCFGKGLLDEAEKLLLKGLELSEKINLLYWIICAQFHLGEIYFELGDFSRSKEHYEKGFRFSEEIRLFPSWVGICKVGFARSGVLNKEKGVALESLYVHARNTKITMLEGWVQRYIGEILLNIDDQHITDAEHWIRNAIEADKRTRMMFTLGKDYALYADWFRKKGDIQGVKEQLTKAIDIFRECGADGWVEKYEKELALIS